MTRVFDRGGVVGRVERHDLAARCAAVGPQIREDLRVQQRTARLSAHEGPVERHRAARERSRKRSAQVCPIQWPQSLLRVRSDDGAVISLDPALTTPVHEPDLLRAIDITDQH
jgi:hypothetical protein